MAIEPIKGFYVHDEATDTDGVAKYDANELAGDIVELADIRVGADGTTYANAGDAVRRQADELHKELNIAQGYKWKNGYITPTGYMHEGDSDRMYSDFLICAGNDVITYVAEQHSKIAGISFYNAEKEFISGVSYTDGDTENTVTSPARAKYFRLSTKTSMLSQTYAKTQTSGLVSLQSQVSEVAEKFDNYIPFETTGTIRSREYTDIGDMLSAKVVNDDYEITLYYIDTSHNTGWQKEIDLTVYPNPVLLQLRKSDNSVMPACSACEVVTAVRNDTLVTAKELTSNKVAYVSPDGSDDNTGTTRSTAFATIQKAVDSGAKTILVKEGIYTDGITLSNLNEVSILLDHYYDAYTAGTDEDNPKIIIDGSTNSLQDGVHIENCTNCKFGNIEVRNTSGRGFYIVRSDNLRFDDCIAHDIGIQGEGSIGGFMIDYTNADFYNCVCYNIGTTTTGANRFHADGFNIHNTGTTNFINCSAWNCEDDGISHHDACVGLIDGGEWYNCGKGGIASPTHGAHIDVKNAYCHNNVFGIYAETDGQNVATRTPINITNCVCKNNTTKDIKVGTYYIANVWNCIYDTSEGFTELT